MINKLILVVLMVVFAAGANAQDGHKPAAGNVTGEVGFNLENGTFLQGGNLRFRYFMADETAFRLGLGAHYNYQKMQENTHSSFYGFQISPGIEKHFAGTDRLSPYVGAEIPLGINSGTYEDGNAIYRGTGSPASPGSGAFFGLNGVAGVDYYFASRFYAGFEFGLGFSYMKAHDVEMEIKSNGNITTTKGYHSFRFSPLATGGLRLGFVF